MLIMKRDAGNICLSMYGLCLNLLANKTAYSSRDSADTQICGYLYAYLLILSNYPLGFKKVTKTGNKSLA